MRDYELCCEIFNQCSNNQMRDVDFQEVSVEDTDAYIRDLEPRAEIEREELADGGVVYHTNTAGLLKRYSFTPILRNRPDPHPSKEGLFACFPRRRRR